MASEHTEKLKRYLQGILPSRSLESIADERISAETLSPAARDLSPEEDRHTRSAVEKLVMNEELTPPEQFALEAIIIPDKRPAIDVIGGDYTVAHPDWTHFVTDAGIRARLKTAIASIGRIELPGHPLIPYGGTGFVVGDGLLMTNRHVAEIFTTGLGIRQLVFREGLASGIDFKRERDRPESIFVDVREVAMIHPYWDMALLRVEGLAAEQAPLTLSLAHPEDLAGSHVAVIGYPAFDPRNDAAVQNKVFGGIYNVKRLQPGQLGGRRSVRSFGKMVDAVVHDSSTLGGNSGSAVVDVKTGEIVALHFGGVYLDANFAVPASELARDGRVVEAGVNFAPGGAPEADIWSDWWGPADPEGA